MISLSFVFSWTYVVKFLRNFGASRLHITWITDDGTHPPGLTATTITHCTVTAKYLATTGSATSTQTIKLTKWPHETEIHNIILKKKQKITRKHNTQIHLSIESLCLPLAEYCILQVRWSLVIGWRLGGGDSTTVCPIIATLNCKRTHLGVGCNRA